MGLLARHYARGRDHLFAVRDQVWRMLTVSKDRPR
jgi:hypothetical protein